MTKFKSIHILLRGIGLFTILGVFTSCQSNILFEEHQELGKEYEWRKDDIKTFVIPIHDNSQPFQFDLGFRYATGYAYNKVLLRMTEMDPQGKRTIRDLEIDVRDANGEFIGEKGYDIIDLTYPLEVKKNFPEHGDYTYTIQHTMPDIDPLNYAMEIGLILRKKEQ